MADPFMTTGGAGDRRRVRAAAPVLLALLLLLPGCSGRMVPPVEDRPLSHALAEPGATRLGRMAASHAPAGTESSGFSLVDTGPDALAFIRGLIALAEKTVDLQYYIWRNDETGRLVLSDLLDAADRGARIRLLLDDMGAGWTDGELARLNGHPNFEVRLFNPFSRSRGRVLDAVLDFQRVTHRMHNKLIISDNAAAMIGGRNIGNQYFSTDKEAHFRDLDLHVAGPTVRKLSASFDAFWNSSWSLSIAVLEDGDRTPSELRKSLAEPPPGTAGAATPPRTKGPAELADHVARVFSGLAWTRRVAVVADEPDKPQSRKSEFLEELAAALPVPKSEVLLESAFLIPGEAGLAMLCGLVRSGVRVRILTNSLSSIDSISAYAGYRKYREDLLRCGIELHELRPRGAASRREWAWSGTASSSILHTKAVLVDRRLVSIGSFNLDPRSKHLNTEIALVMDNPEIAAATARFIEAGMSPESSYRLSLEDGEIAWHMVEAGEPVRLTEEPGATFWGRLTTWLISLLPIERQL